MKGWLIALGVLFCLWLVGRLRLGVFLTHQESLTLRLRVGVFRFVVIPKPEKAEKKPKKAKKEKKTTEKPEKGAEKKIADPVGLVLKLLPLLTEAAGKLRRKIRVDQLMLAWTGGGLDDPAGTAILYGRLQAAVGGILPALESAVQLKEYRIRLNVDYSSEKTVWEIALALSMTLGQLLALSVWLGWNALMIFMEHSRTNKQKVGIRNGEQKSAN